MQFKVSAAIKSKCALRCIESGALQSAWAEQLRASGGKWVGTRSLTMNASMAALPEVSRTRARSACCQLSSLGQGSVTPALHYFLVVYAHLPPSCAAAGSNSIASQQLRTTPLAACRVHTARSQLLAQQATASDCRRSVLTTQPGSGLRCRLALTCGRVLSLSTTRSAYWRQHCLTVQC